MKNKPNTPFELPLLPPSIDYSLLVSDMSKAHIAIARLDETLLHLLNPGIIERTFLTQEAVLSSQIEGTQATLEEVFKEEAEAKNKTDETTKKMQEIREVINYRMAISEGVSLVEKDNPLAENTVKKLHKILLHSVRGKTKAPGEFRKSQVHIGPPGTPLAEATFVPPVPTAIPSLYSNFDKYFNTPDAEIDPLVQIAVAHYQFEAIHPFNDGNGRVGRLLIPLFLFQRKLLSHPYMYLSKYFERYRRDYYDLLADVSYKQAWTPWLRFFLNGLAKQADEARMVARKIVETQQKFHAILSKFQSPYALNLLDALFGYPICSTKKMKEIANISNTQTLINLIKKFVKSGILVDTTPDRKRNKTYAFLPLLEILENNRDDS
ncbi:Fic family protein [Patescibacteria group bacterium]|nr:Fic family protein [Patescibacteria group bacterium]MBU1890012.1 Fic family protein [Patescibacteria group bacterium]